MDKSTLSNYGWIVIAVLVLSVMIALATPFGTYIENGVKSTTAGLFDTSEKALNVVGMSAGSGNFEDGYQGVDSDETETLVAGVTFSDGTFLTWTELMLDENGNKYGYNAFLISDTEIPSCQLYNLDFVSVIIPNSISYIGEGVFCECNLLTAITYLGTMEQWDAISKDLCWNSGSIIEQIICTDGTIIVPLYQ